MWLADFKSLKLSFFAVGRRQLTHLLTVMSTKIGAVQRYGGRTGAVSFQEAAFDHLLNPTYLSSFIPPMLSVILLRKGREGTVVTWENASPAFLESTPVRGLCVIHR